MRKIVCMHTKNDCYIQNNGGTVTPIGIVVHSTGANNTTVKRYSQPASDDPNRAELLALIGTNTYNNHWNKSGVSKAVHYFIGKLADGSVASVQNLPEHYYCWGCGRGSYGSYNYAPTACIQFEICEDGLANANYFNTVMKEAQELCADICLRHNWDANVIVSHKEAHSKGYASNHSDINHWLSKFGKTMAWFRDCVQAMLDEARKPAPEPEPEPYVPAVGDIVNFTGTVHYRSANATAKYSCKPGLAQLTRIYNGKHPYHCKAISGSTATVSGWVDAEFVKQYIKEVKPEPTPEPTPAPAPEPVPEVVEIKVGDKVKLLPNATWANGKKASSWVYKTTLYVREIQKSSGKTVYLLSRYETVKAYTGKAYREAIEKI